MLLILAVAVFMDQMDNAALATVLPVIAADLGLTPMAVKLALTSYLLAMAMFIPVCGWLARRFGAKRVFRAALLLFLAGSLGSALSQGLTSLVAARFVQGAGAAAMVPIARIIIVRGVAREDLVQALAWWTLPAMIAPVIGPLVGGALATWASWQWIFLINLPIGLAGWVLSARYIPDVAPEPTGPLDLTGFALSGAAFATLILGLSLISMPLIPPWVAALLLVFGTICGAAAARRFRGAANPLLDLRLLRDPAFRASITAGFLFRIGSGGVHFLMPLLLQMGFGLSALQSGMLTFSGALGAAGSKLISARLYARHGFALVLLVSALATGVLQVAGGWLTPGIPPLVIIGYMALGGILRSTFFAGVSALGYRTIPDDKAADVSALTAVSQQLATSAGITVAGMLVGAFGSAGSPDLAALQWSFALIGAVSGLAALCLPRAATGRS